MSTKDKVIKLLRLAEDRAGTPEGATAEAMAHKLMAIHDIEIAEDDVAFEGPNEVVHHVVAQMEERTWWTEMLLVTLCDLYGGEAVVIGGPPWLLHVIVEPEDEVDLPDLQRHYEYLSDIIEDLCHASASDFMRAVPAERDRAIASFCIGAVYRISQMLYFEEREEELDLEQMPFMVRALTGSVASPQEAKEVFGTEPTQGNLAHLFETELPPLGNQVRDDLIEVVPDWSWYDVGYRNAKVLIKDPYP